MPDIENKIEASKQAHAPKEKKRAGWFFLFLSHVKEHTFECMFQV